MPGLVLLDAEGKIATKALPVPRKKDEFTLDAIKQWLGDNGITVTKPDTPSYPEKEYSDPADKEHPDEEEEEEDEVHDMAGMDHYD